MSISLNKNVFLSYLENKYTLYFRPLNYPMSAANNAKISWWEGSILLRRTCFAGENRYNLYFICFFLIFIFSNLKQKIEMDHLRLI